MSSVTGDRTSRSATPYRPVQATDPWRIRTAWAPGASGGACGLGEDRVETGGICRRHAQRLAARDRVSGRAGGCAVPSGPHAGAARRRAVDQGGRAVALGPPGLEEVAQLVVVVRRAGHRPADVLGDVVVAEATASGSPNARERTSAEVHSPMPGSVRSRASASSRGQPGRGCRRPSRPGRACASGPGRCASAATPTTGRGSGRGVGLDPQLSSRPGPGARSPYRWTSVRNPANASWPVTFCSMIAGTRASKTPVAARRSGHEDGLRWASRTSGWRSARSRTGRRRHRASREAVERPAGAVAPGLGHDVAVAGPWSDPERGRAVRRTDAPPRLVALHLEGRVSPAVALLAEDAECVTRPPGPPHPPRRLRHAPNLRAGIDRLGDRARERQRAESRSKAPHPPGSRHGLAQGLARLDHRSHPTRWLRRSGSPESPRPSPTCEVVSRRR